MLTSHTRRWLGKAVMIVRLGRPKFLLGGLALFGLGTLCAQRMTGAFDWVAYVWGQVTVLAIQLMTHYSNDYFDYHADVANIHPTPWSGGSRVLVDAKLEPGVALKAALIAALCAAASGIVLVAARPAAWSGGVLLAGMLVLSWSYSAPPLRLHNRGLGEPTVWLVVPIATPLAGFLVQTHGFASLPVLLVVPLSLLLLSMLLTLELPDELGDRSVGKLSWAVLWGGRRISVVCILLIVAAFVGRFASGELGVPQALANDWLWLIPVASFQLWRLLAGDGKVPRVWGRLAFGAVALFFLALVLDLVSLYRLPSAGVQLDAAMGTELQAQSKQNSERRARRVPRELPDPLCRDHASAVRPCAGR